MYSSMVKSFRRQGMEAVRAISCKCRPLPRDLYKRQAPGSAREIGAIFAAMGAGLMAGMGYLGYAALFALILGGITMACLLYTSKIFLCSLTLLRYNNRQEISYHVRNMK